MADVRSERHMPLDVRRLLEASLTKLADPLAFRAAVLLWCHSWHSVPAGTILDDDEELAGMLGMELLVWREIRSQALHGFAPCDDGLLRHRLISELAEETERRLEQAARRRLAARNKKRNQRGMKAVSEDVPRDTNLSLGTEPMSLGTDPLVPRDTALVPGDTFDPPSSPSSSPLLPPVPSPPIKTPPSLPPSSPPPSSPGTPLTPSELTLFGRAEPAVKATKARNGARNERTVTAIWEAYSDAYEFRHGSRPPRGAKVNAQIANMLRDVPAEDLIEVVRYFVGLNEAFYVRAMHPLGALQRDLLKIHTLWVTGKRSSAHRAAEMDRREAAADAVDEAMSLLNGRQRHE